MLTVKMLLAVVLLYIIGGCQALEPKEGSGEKKPAEIDPRAQSTTGEMMTVKFKIPALSDFKTQRGDGSGILTHFAYRLEALEPQCSQAQTSNVLSYAGPREERLSVPRLCKLRIKFAIGNMLPAIGQQFQPMFETNQPINIEPQIWLAGREAGINYTLNRLAPGQGAGFTATEINVLFSNNAFSPPTNSPFPNATPTYQPFPQPTLTPNSQNNNRVIDFRIKAGTGNGAWNDAATAVNARVGQVVRIHNDDSVVHQLHTDGAPCGHGNAIRPGASADCVIGRAYSGQPLYDHGTRGQFFISAQQ